MGQTPWSFENKPRAVAVPKQPQEPSEHQEQKALVEWFKIQFSGVRILSIPNGAYLAGNRFQRATQMGRLRAEGLSPGAPDLLVPAWRLWIEMKRRVGGVVSEEQSDWHEYLESIGDAVIIGHGFEDAARKIRAFRVPA